VQLISQLVEDVLASQEGLCLIEIISLMAIMAHICLSICIQSGQTMNAHYFVILIWTVTISNSGV
jgi:hypothetical protein